MAFNVSYVFEAIDKFSGIGSRIKSKVDQISTSFNKMRKKIKAAGKTLDKVGKNLSLKVTAPLIALAGFSLKAAADIETMEVAFESMTGSAEKASEVVKSLIDFTARTPFQLEGVGKAAKQLLSFGVSVDDLEGKLKFLGDISAGANVPLSDMASIFGKVKAKGKAMTEEILQLSDRGIPIIDVLAKRLGVAKNRIFDLASEGKLSFKIIQDALVSMTEKGGIFFNQMDKQSKTLGGVFSTLKDNINLALASIGIQLVKTFDLKEVLSSMITGLQRATKAFNSFVANNPKLAKFVFILGAMLAVLGPLAIAMGIVAISIAAISTPILIAVGAVTALLTAGALLIAFWDDLKQAMQNVIDFWSASFNAVVSDISGKIGQIASFLGIGGGPGVAAQQQGTKSRLDGRIVVEAPNGGVKSVESSTSGNGVGDLGMNMAGAM